MYRKVNQNEKISGNIYLFRETWQWVFSLNNCKITTEKKKTAHYQFTPSMMFNPTGCLNGKFGPVRTLTFLHDNNYMILLIRPSNPYLSDS